MNRRLQLWGIVLFLVVMAGWLSSCSLAKFPSAAQTAPSAGVNESGTSTPTGLPSPTPSYPIPTPSVTNTPYPSNPTALSAGDVAILGFTTHGTQNDQFAFVILKDVGAGTEVNLSDMNWDGNEFATSDGGVIVWTVDRPYPAGTVVQVLPTSNGSASSTHAYAVNIYSGSATFTNVTGPGSQSGTYAFSPDSPIQVVTVANTGGGLTGMAQEGDQLIAYQGSTALGAPASAVTFIAGLNFGSAWLTGTPTPTDFSQYQGESYLPPGLTNGQNAMAIPSGWGNGGYYDCANGATGSPSQLDALINNPSNWMLSMSSNNLPVPVVSCPFQVQ